MTPQARKKLIKALRSGRYRQIRGEETDYTGGYCAMGVAREIGIIEGFEDPQEVQVLVNMNDREGLTFDEIADQLEGPTLARLFNYLYEPVKALKASLDDNDPPGPFAMA